MNNIFEDLWYGRLDSYTKCKTADCETEELEEYIERHKKSLSETMTDAQKETFDKLLDCYTEFSDINERKIFSHGFKLGMQVAITALWSCDE